MPRMDGVAATRAHPRPGAARPPQVPIIALTANADPEDAAAISPSGMNGVVEKPIKPERLLHGHERRVAGGRRDRCRRGLSGPVRPRPEQPPAVVR